MWESIHLLVLLYHPQPKVAISPGSRTSSRLSSAPTSRGSRPPTTVSYARRYGRFSLERIAEAVTELVRCGDYRFGVARLKCSNPSCGREIFRPFSCEAFYLCPYVLPAPRNAPCCSPSSFRFAPDHGLSAPLTSLPRAPTTSVATGSTPISQILQNCSLTDLRFNRKLPR